MNNYTVIVVGPRNSGKTVFLASMYRRLSTPGKFKFYLEADDTTVGERQISTRQELVSRYSRLADTKQPWEPGTIDIERWKFTCKVQRPDSGFKTYTACQFTYVDFAGGDLTQQRNEELDYEIKNAHCILGLLDGQKILHLMRNQDEGNELLYTDLANMIAVMNEQKNPIHFIISKWDLLEKAKISLKQVYDRLLQDESFDNFVQNRLEGNVPVRLIPVSAVGMEFAELQEDGSMIKIPGKALKPFKVEAPIACILPDKVKAELKQIIEKKKNMDNQQINYSNEVHFWDSVLEIIGGGVELFRQNIIYQLPPELRFTDELLKRLGEAAKAGAQLTREQQSKRMAELENQRNQSLKAVENEQSALEYAVKSFLEIQGQLDEDFPDSCFKDIKK